jgi:hypothetical protein
VGWGTRLWIVPTAGIPDPGRSRIQGAANLIAPSINIRRDARFQNVRELAHRLRNVL